MRKQAKAKNPTKQRYFLGLNYKVTGEGKKGMRKWELSFVLEITEFQRQQSTGNVQGNVRAAILSSAPEAAAATNQSQE